MAAAADAGDLKSKTVVLSDWQDPVAVLDWLVESTSNAMSPNADRSRNAHFVINGREFKSWNLRIWGNSVVPTQRMFAEEGTYDAKASMLVEFIDSDYEKLGLYWEIRNRGFIPPIEGDILSTQRSIVAEDKLGFPPLYIRFHQDRPHIHHEEWTEGGSTESSRSHNVTTRQLMVDMLGDRGIPFNAAEAFREALQARNIPEEILRIILVNVDYDPHTYLFDSKSILTTKEGEPSHFEFKQSLSNPPITDRRGQDPGNATKPYAISFSETEPPEHKRARTGAPIAARQDEIACAVCGAKATGQCSACKRQFYCDDLCKVAGWVTGHKDKCLQ